MGAYIKFYNANIYNWYTFNSGNKVSWKAVFGFNRYFTNLKRLKYSWFKEFHKQPIPFCSHNVFIYMLIYFVDKMSPVFDRKMKLHLINFCEIKYNLGVNY